MPVLKEWRCAAHGDFEGTHPICPSMGCMSDHVERAFRTPVGISQGKYRRFENGLRTTAERMGISDWRTAREGEAGFAGRAPLGSEILWGDEVKKHPEMGGRSFSQLTAAAQQPLAVDRPANDPYVTINSGMRTAATELGITQSRIPRAEITGDLRDKRA